MFRRAPVLMYTGVVSSWKQGSPYGFIKDTETGASYFLHKDDIVDGSRNRVNNLPEGFRVEFDKAMHEGRTKAVAVTLRGGAPITSTGESRRDERRDDRDYDREDRRRDDRDYDREDRRRDDRRRDDRDDRRSDTIAYDKELSRIQGSLAALSRAAIQANNQQSMLYNALVNIAATKGVVVPGLDDEAARTANSQRWAKYNETSGELREQAKERRAERRAERAAKRGDGAAEEKGDEARKSAFPGKSTSTTDAEDMF